MKYSETTERVNCKERPGDKRRSDTRRGGRDRRRHIPSISVFCSDRRPDEEFEERQGFFSWRLPFPSSCSCIFLSCSSLSCSFHSKRQNQKHQVLEQTQDKSCFKTCVLPKFLFFIEFFLILLRLLPLTLPCDKQTFETFSLSC